MEKYSDPQPQGSTDYQQYQSQQSYAAAGGYPPTSGYDLFPGQTSPFQAQGHHMQSNHGSSTNQASWYPLGPAYREGSPPPQYAQRIPEQPRMQAVSNDRPGISGWDNVPTITDHQYHEAQAMKQQPTRAPGNSPRSLADKFSSLMHRRHSDSALTVHTDSSDDDNKKKKKQKNKFATIPQFDPRDGPYPFSVFCAKNNPELIVLSIVDAGVGHDLLVGPNHDIDHPAYKIEYADENEFEVYRCELPMLNPKKAEFAGSSKPKANNVDGRNSRLKIKFPWGKWEHEIFDSWWISHVGLLAGKSDMKWYLLERMNTYKNGKLVARCFDTTTPSMPTVASFYMDDFDFGKLEIVAGLIRTQEQLDELVTVAFGAMCYFRSYVRENPDGKATENVRKPLKK